MVMAEIPATYIIFLRGGRERAETWTLDFHGYSKSKYIDFLKTASALYFLRYL
jgi:hypothetical protein